MKGNDKDFTFAKFMAGRGFYLAMALCVVGTGTAAWVAVDRTIGSIDKNNSEIVGEKSPGFSGSEEAGKGQSGVGIGSSSSSKSPAKPQSSSTSPQRPDAGSKPSTPQVKPQSLQFVLPIKGEIIAPYSGGKLIKDPTLNEWRTHNGLDIKAPKGTAVTTAAAGKVINVYDDAMWGTTVEVLHENDITTFYCGLEKNPMVKKGDTVKASQQLGTVGSVPSEMASGEHIHFATKKNGKWVDPVAALALKTSQPAA